MPAVGLKYQTKARSLKQLGLDNYDTSVDDLCALKNTAVSRTPPAKAATLNLLYLPLNLLNYKPRYKPRCDFQQQMIIIAHSSLFQGVFLDKQLAYRIGHVDRGYIRSIAVLVTIDYATVKNSARPPLINTTMDSILGYTICYTTQLFNHHLKNRKYLNVCLFLHRAKCNFHILNFIAPIDCCEVMSLSWYL